ncbi:hypothetical protein IFT67_20000 [Sphingomonas sp. CFBP 13728]|uniref:hypothetical protein n=1 Tax=Sphingomonas sp. CFBP 13728 TaxID=2775294 RepID=UPI001780DED5|nr:hypothetical protein [Sphingomonas sp. CFBP 13728]MBD8621196.1 hypothetical protein [Sphingomonas sp. CFBP 13728]
MFKLKTEEQLLEEIRAVVAERTPMALAQTRGTLQMLGLRTRAEGVSEDNGVSWALRAQIGSLEKLIGLLPEGRNPSSVELLASARNLFENLVWLKLFLIDPGWGDFFYGQLLKNQKEDLAGMVTKLQAEADLFDSLDNEYNNIFADTFDSLNNRYLKGDQTATEMTQLLNEHREKIDRKARRHFALYAAAAVFNGYGYQRHLLIEKQIPHWRSQLALIDDRINDFSTRMADPAKVNRYLGQWQWRSEALRVGMVAQYDFLYRLTSRLLHATPMNIITEKELIEGERITLLEYIAISVPDAIDAIDAFQFPGRIDAIHLEWPGDDAGEN